MPDTSARFGGDLVLVSQADQELVFARGLRPDETSLTRLSLTHGGSSASVDDVRWAARHGGSLYIIDNKTNTVYKLRGPFESGQAFGALDTVGGVAAGTEVDTINLATGALSPLATGFGVVKGLLWVG